MTDPIADAAAQQQNDPSLLEKAMDTIHSLEAKVEHLMHPEAGAGEQSAASTVSTLEAANGPASGGAMSEAESTGSMSQSAGSAEVPNAAASPAVVASSGVEATVQSTLALGAASAIRDRLQAIKGHLLGFEESSRQKIHAELEAIERLL